MLRFTYCGTTTDVTHQQNLIVLIHCQYYSQAIPDLVALTLNIAGEFRAVWTAAASASVKPITAVWLGDEPKPALDIIDRNRSTVGFGFQVVGTLNMNSIRASSHLLASSPFNLASIHR